MGLQGLTAMAYALAVTVSLVLAGFDERPRHTAGMEGETARINCTIDLSQSQVLSWEARYNDADGDINLYNCAGAMDMNTCTISPDDFEIDQDARHDLIIRELRHELSGMYKCKYTDFAPGGISDGVEVDLMTLSDVRCPDSMGHQDAGDTPNFECSVDVSGLYDPFMEWYVDGTLVGGQLVEPVVQEGEEPILAPARRTVAYAYNFTVDHTHDMVAFECRLSFSGVQNGDSPLYTDSCTTTFSVTFGVTEIMISPDPDDFTDGIIEIYVGDRINCTAKGSPEPYFVWERLSGGGELQYIHEQTLLVTEDMIGDNNEYMCTATNSPNAQTAEQKKTVKFSAFEDPDRNAAGATHFYPISLAVAFILAGWTNRML